MNSPSLHSISLTKSQCELLQALSRVQLAAGVHSALTAPLIAPKQRTAYILGQADAHVARCEVLRWLPTDSLRAYRNLPTPVVLELISLISNAATELLKPREVRVLGMMGDALKDTLNRSLGIATTPTLTQKSATA